VTAGPNKTAERAAVFVPQARDFDGGLLERRTYLLNRADALALLQLRREWPGRAKVALGLWFMAGGVVFGLLPDSLTGEVDSWRSIVAFGAVLAAQFGLVMLGMTIWQHLRARQLVPQPRPAVFEEWIDCIAATEIGSTEEAYLSPELIGQVIDTPEHIFVSSHPDTLVIPTRAFDSPEAARAMADHIRKLAEGPYYFEA
jgi:hypothetical protein